MAAFGRAGAELLPLLLKIGPEGTDSIVTMSDEQISRRLRTWTTPLDAASGGMDRT